MINDIAIIICLYKDDNISFFKDALNSLFHQERVSPNIYLYIDGELNGELLSYVETLKNNSDIKIFHNKKNMGLAYGLNYLIKNIIPINEIKYIARMDSDDISLPTRLYQQWEFMENNVDIDILGCQCEEFGSSFSITKKLPIEHNEILNFSITRCPLIHPTVFFRKKVFQHGIKYPTHTHFTEDMCLWLELLYKGYKFHNLDKVLFKYRLNENTLYRRRGINKAYNEVYLRLGYMFLLKKFSIRNTSLILSRFVFHLLPNFILKFLYKYFR